MSLKDLKFTTADFYDKDVSSLPDRPSEAGITAAELKARFDQIPKMMLALGGFNDMVDELTGENGAGNIGAKSGRLEGETVAEQLENAGEKLGKKLEGVTVNGKDTPIENGKAKITLPTKVSEFDNDSGYINEEESKALIKTETAALAAVIDAGDESTLNKAAEYTDNKSATTLNAAKAHSAAYYQLKQAGKGLSQEDYTTAEKDKLNSIEEGAQRNPAALPNPAALSFTGAVSGSYDGSRTVTIEIPESGSNDEAVTYTKQNLTEAQRAQARENIGALGINDVPKVPENVLTYDAQTLTAAQKEQARENIGVYTVSVKDYGAKGNNSTDDTAAFQNALANERVVYVPGGKYKLSGELVLGSNCQLELAQDAVLYFTQTTGNCISMKSSANIVGNHATISVPYAFSGKVINIDGGLDTTQKDVPPFTQWDPMWKTARYITDLNIVKPDSRGFYYSVDGNCSGIAVYLNADAADAANFIWATDLSKLRIAGAFTYGVFAESVKSGSSGWIHQLRLDGFIDGSEVALYFKKIEHAYAAVKVLPRRAFTIDEKYVRYAKWGICLEDSHNINLLGSRVMDWNETYSLWAEGNMYQHIALLGNCTDVKMDDFLYYAMPNYDIRSLIYTDTPSNLESVSILEEPITRWFKPIDGVPYFNDGFTEKPLLLQEDLKEVADTQRVANFTNVLPNAKNADGSVFNDIGYVKYGYRLNSDGTLKADQYSGCTGFIPVKQNDVVYVKGLKIPDVLEANGGTYGFPVVMSFDSSFAYMAHCTGKNVAANGYFFGYEATDDGFKLTVKQRSTVAYVRFSYPRENIGEQPIVSINNPITYSQVGYLQDSIKVKTANVEGLSEILGSYIDDVDALLGGG